MITVAGWLGEKQTLKRAAGVRYLSNPRHLGTWTSRYLVLTWTSRYSVLDISVLTRTSRYWVLDSSGLGRDNIPY